MRLTFAVGLFWLSVACCAIAQLFIIRSVRGTRHVPEPTAGVPRSREAMEMMWAVLPALGLIALLFFTWKAVVASSASAPSQSQTSVVLD
jgi:heme/copper-type cytochrome/quinol oxidase subunit 2